MFSLPLQLTTLVRLCDPETRLVLLRVPRDHCGKVRASLTLLTQLGGPGSIRRPVVLSVLSVNGSARTAKLSIMAYVKKVYRSKLQQLRKTSFEEAGGIEFEREFTKLQDLMHTIQGID